MKKLLMIALILSSCYSSKQANKELNKAYNKYPENVAKFARDKFPCKETNGDSAVRVEYEFIEIKCPDFSDSISKQDTLYIDKISKPKTYIITKNKFVAVPSITKTITKIIRDSSCELLLNKSVADNKLTLQKMDGKSNWIKWLLILLAISLILNLLFITTKFVK